MAAADVAANKVEVIKKYEGFKASSFPEVPDLTIQQLQDMLQDKSRKVVLVDARTSDEQDVSMIPGAVRRSPDFEQLDKAELKDTTIVAYCTVGARSGKFAKQLLQDGFKDVYNLRGSIISWTHEGLPLVAPDGTQTKRVHTFGNSWALQGEGYEPVTFSAPREKIEAVKSVLPRWAGGTA
jgi:sodium/bile acid cotransporter 7